MVKGLNARINYRGNVANSPKVRKKKKIEKKKCSENNKSIIFLEGKRENISLAEDTL